MNKTGRSYFLRAKPAGWRWWPSFWSGVLAAVRSRRRRFTTGKASGDPDDPHTEPWPSSTAHLTALSRYDQPTEGHRVLSGGVDPHE